MWRKSYLGEPGEDQGLEDQGLEDQEKKGELMRRIAKMIVGLSLLLALVAPSAVSGQAIGATSGEISVYNESGFRVTIYISDHERGVLDPNYSKTFKVPLGSHRVRAVSDSQYGKEGYHDFVITSTYPYDSWYIHNSDMN